MRKIIIAISAFAIGAGAYAKALSELAGEYDKLTELSEKVAYLNANKADGAAAYGAWDGASGTGAEKKFFGALYYSTDALDGIPDAEGVKVNFEAWARKALAKNPQAFALCRAGGYVVGGQKLPVDKIIRYAHLAGDKQAVYELDPFEVAHCGSGRAIQNYLDAVKTVALAAANNEAYGKSLELENAFEELPEGAFKTQTLVVISRLQDALFYRITRAAKLEEAAKSREASK
ncbi:MAG: hypothetical protein IJI37_04030 [Opitutales bacterium]|nr:hypothetical protein [Opitutales bacterium]